jgi:UDP-glucose 4-epimerase
MRILVTGGAGYIGTHTCVEILDAGHEAIVVDNLSNSKEEALLRVGRIAGRPLKFVRADIRDGDALRGIFARQAIDAVIHFAGLKAVGESVVKPLEYYHNNVYGSIVLLQAMRDAGVRTIVFSSSATVYGDPPSNPIREDFPLRPANPYGRAKLMIEEILRDAAASESGCRVAILRYFNPVGAHPSGLIGEDPLGVPNNLMPYICLVASGRLQALSVFGSDYPTRDGTGMRDYIHVVDLARGHLAALDALTARAPQVLTANLGTGRGHSVLEMVRAFEAATGRNIPLRMADRRPGDIAEYYADPGFAREALGWRAELRIEHMCRDAWRWQQWQTEHAAEL